MPIVSNASRRESRYFVVAHKGILQYYYGPQALVGSVVTVVYTRRHYEQLHGEITG